MINYVSHFIELLVADHYSKKYGLPVFQPVGYFCGFDGTAYNSYPDLRYEVKLDTLALKSGNLAFEISWNGRPSGLTNTQALTWVHVVPESATILTCYEFPVQALRETVRDVKPLYGGDRKASGLVVLPRKEVGELASGLFKINIPWGTIRPYWIAQS